MVCWEHFGSRINAFRAMDSFFVGKADNNAVNMGLVDGVAVPEKGTVRKDDLLASC